MCNCPTKCIIIIATTIILVIEQPNSNIFKANHFTEEKVDASTENTQAVKKMLYESQSYISYLEHSKSFQPLTTVVAEGSQYQE